VVLGELQVDVSPALNQLKDFARNERGLIDYHKLWNLLPNTDASTSSPVVPKIESAVQQPELIVLPPGTIMVKCLHLETSKKSDPRSLRKKETL
jgi:hypothetical protein